MLFHTVLFQYDGDTEQGVIDKGLELLLELASIPAVKAIAVGANLVDVQDGWTHGMTITFDSFEAMRNEFGGHPTHLAVLEEILPTWSRFMAMDVATP